MTLLSFEFEDLATGWKLHPVKFDGFNLLVGYSGVGKSMILRALNEVRDAVLEKRGLDYASKCSWKMVLLDRDNKKYIWDVSTGDAYYDDQEPYPAYLTESIICGEKNIFRRDRTGVFYLEERMNLPLKEDESAITLLNDPDILALRRLIYCFIQSRTDSSVDIPHEKLKNLLGQFQNEDSLRDSREYGLLIKGYVLNKKFPGSYKRVLSEYQEIFPNVEDVEIDTGFFDRNDNKVTVSLAIREGGNLILDISEGMLRTFFILLEIALAPDGAVILIDEIENSLGVNCLGPVIDFMLKHAGRVQFIVTSHHPYVINNVPLKWWKLVTRKGSDVWVRPASEIPALQTKSLHDKFLLLINAAEFEEGIGAPEAAEGIG